MKNFMNSVSRVNPKCRERNVTVNLRDLELVKLSAIRLITIPQRQPENSAGVSFKDHGREFFRVDGLLMELKINEIGWHSYNKRRNTLSHCELSPINSHNKCKADFHKVPLSSLFWQMASDWNTVINSWGQGKDHWEIDHLHGLYIYRITKLCQF